MANDPFPNHEQRAVVEAREGGVLVMAPAGTGKTRVMAARLARAIDEGHAADHCLCLTFTNRAANEMRARVRDTIGDAVREAHVSTFHALCARVLRAEADALGLPRDFVVYDDLDGPELLREGAREIGIRLDEKASAALFYDLTHGKSTVSRQALRLDWHLAHGPAGSWGSHPVVARYHALLRDRHALDFADLVYGVRALFALQPAVAERWARRYRWVQIDEVQDTHASEYEIVAHLASASGNLGLFGDGDQTIFGWRGSEPRTVLRAFERGFAPVRRFDLTLNYRSTRRLLVAADRVAQTLSERWTRLTPSPGLPDGEPVLSRRFSDPEAEARWIAQEVDRSRKTDRSGRIGILARTHARTLCVSGALARARIPHVTVEQFQFFRRQEVKDVLARLRLILHPFDGGALRRILLRPPSGISSRTVGQIVREGNPLHLRLTDLVRPGALAGGDPLGPFLDALQRDDVLVIDVETTGFSPEEDDLVEIAALPVGMRRSGAPFRRLVRPRFPVGASEKIHGYSDARLREEGEPTADALEALAALAEGRHLVGHNVVFDLGMIAAAARREGVSWPDVPWDDTLDLARRLLPDTRHDLAHLAETLGLEHRPSHQALSDVQATADLARVLAQGLEKESAARAALVREHGAAFAPLAEQLATWRTLARDLRPAHLLANVIETSGLRRYYAREEKRRKHLDELVAFAAACDDPSLGPRAALDEVVRVASLAKNVDHLRPDDTRIPVITVHQAKGLEFDTVFLAGISEGEFPSFLAERDGNTDEEHRLFYVGVTRARRRLVVTAYDTNSWGYRKGPSRLFDLVAG